MGEFFYHEASNLNFQRPRLHNTTSKTIFSLCIVAIKVELLRKHRDHLIQFPRNLQPPFPLGIKGAPYLCRSSSGVPFRALCLRLAKVCYCKKHKSMALLLHSRSTIFPFAEPDICQAPDRFVLSSSCHSLNCAADLTCELDLQSASPTHSEP